MLKSVAMQKIDILILESHIDEVVAKIGFSGSMEFISSLKSKSENFENEMRDSITKLFDLKERFESLTYNISFKKTEKEIIDNKDYFLSLFKIEEELSAIESEINETVNTVIEIENSKRELLNIYEKLQNFGKIDISLDKLSKFDFVQIVYGKIPLNKFKTLEKIAGKRILCTPIGNQGEIICMSSKKGKWALETALSKCDFVKKDLSQFSGKTVKELITDTQNEFIKLNSEYQVLQDRIDNFKSTHFSTLEKIAVSLFILDKIVTEKNKFDKTNQVFHISGWVEGSQANNIVDELCDITDDKILIQITNPREIPSYKRGNVKVPIKLKKRKFLSNFEILVKNYGLPDYGEIDPTFFVAISYMIMFGMMFGDVGQGFVFLLLGILAKTKKVKPLKKFSHLGIIFMGMGFFAMTFGFLYGSVFGAEHLFHPILGSPLNNFMTIFKLAIGYGVVFISIGLIINIVNTIKKRKLVDVLFDKCGIAGTWFYWGVIALAIKIAVFNWKFQLVSLEVLIFVLLPLIMLFLKAPIHWYTEKRKGHTSESFTSVILESIIETIDTMIYFFGNTASFLRMGALALSHASLSFAIFKMADLLKGSTAGNIAAIIVIILGNIFIIALEGLVAYIQTMRLQYYEFFSKFFTAGGKTFKPFKLSKKIKLSY